MPFLFLFFSSSIFAQHQLQVKNKSAEEIIQIIEKQYAIRFNFSHNNLPTGIFTFSSSGSLEVILKTTFSVLNRKYVELDETVYAIQSNIFPKKEKVKPLLISGKVMDIYGSGLPIATVWIPKLELAFETNSEGIFTIKGFFAPDEKVEFRYLGYQPQIKTITQLLSTKNPKILLSFQQHVLGEIIITSQPHQPISTEELEDVLLLPEQIMPLAGRADKDVLSLVQLLPGMYTADESATEIQTRGGPPDQTNFEWNGIQIYQTNHFYGKISAINPFVVDKIHVIKNGASAHRSGQASGTISMQDSDNTVDSLRGKIHSNLLYSNVGLNIPLWKNRAQLRVTWRHSYSQFFQNVTFNSFFANAFQFGKLENEEYLQSLFPEGFDLTARLSFQDLFGVLKIDLSKKDFIKISSAKINNEFKYVKSGDLLDSTPTDVLKDENLGFGFQYARNWTAQWTTQIKATSSKFNYRYQYLENPENFANTEEELQENRLKQRAFQITQSYENQRWKFSTGFKYEHWQYNLYEITRMGNSVNIGIEDGLMAHEKSAFLQGFWKGSPFWQLDAGVRYSDYELGAKKYWEPRLHASIFPAKNWTLHAHWGLYHQALNKEHVDASFEVADRFWYLSNEKE